MKKTVYLLLLSILLISCYSITKVTSKKHNFTKDIDFSINKVEERVTISDSPRSKGVYQSNAEDKFVLINLNIINTSNQQQEFNFNNFYLFNPATNIQYRADWMLSSSLLEKNSGINYFIQKKSNLNRTLVFVFPKKEKASFLKIENQIIEINTQIQKSYEKIDIPAPINF
tara:strand:+ start:37525 stop:38037 length:513 start_codon:yes stop_codon:yes gene_type:complete